MTRDGLVEVNETQQTAERISKRTQDADFQKSLEQQAAQDAAQLQGAASPTSPLPHAPGAAPKADTGKTERVMEHIEAAHTRKASKKAVRKAQAEATAGTKSSRRCKSMADAAKFGFGDIRCHQMSPDVRILTEKQVVMLLFKSGC